ncbi:MAG: Crp/Fnr family transcriptional regulator [Proteobacteria bacterium]|uniref:Crp/Fnr family transcriptional regulator n=1 Tax=Aquabacterium sp. TaxID=1872578 RepID=UPI0035C6C4C1|nr:Crp/Fnr family transcriptional regulator [Pseudomonadota bacterium]
MIDCPVDVTAGLRGTPVFRALPDDVLHRLAQDAQVLTLSRSDMLFHRGQPCEGLHVLLQGQAKVYARVDKAQDGGQDKCQEKVIEVVTAPACLGESMLSGEVDHRVHAAMLSDGVVLLLPRASVMRELQDSPALAVQLLADVSGRLNRMVHDIEAVTLHSAAQRVVAYLLHHRAAETLVTAAPLRGRVPAHGATRAVTGQPPPPSECTVSLPASKGTIASLLSVTPEHFSRILHDLQARGLIAVNRRQIHIPDVARLACLA